MTTKRRHLFVAKSTALATTNKRMPNIIYFHRDSNEPVSPTTTCLTESYLLPSRSFSPRLPTSIPNADPFLPLQFTSPYQYPFVTLIVAAPSSPRCWPSRSLPIASFSIALSCNHVILSPCPKYITFSLINQSNQMILSCFLWGGSSVWWRGRNLSIGNDNLIATFKIGEGKESSSFLAKGFNKKSDIPFFIKSQIWK